MRHLEHVEHLLFITYRGKYRPDVLGMDPHKLRLKTDANLSLLTKLEWDLVQRSLACETIANSRPHRIAFLRQISELPSPFVRHRSIAAVEQVSSANLFNSPWQGQQDVVQTRHGD